MKHKWPLCTRSRLVVYNQCAGEERASYNGSIEASQASDVGSIPIARSITSDDSNGLTWLSRLNPAYKWSVLDRSWTVLGGVNPLDGTNYLDTVSAFIEGFSHVLAGEGVWERGRHLSPFPQ